ncbi:MAG: 3'-5' exonuclease, partial [Bacteroidota bacterium]
MLEQIDIANVLFLDIETVSGHNSYEDLSEDFKPLWAHKAKSALRNYTDELDEETVAAAYQDKAAIYAEFGKIVCISVGVVYRNKDKRLSIRLKSFASKDEKELLTGFAQLLNQYYNDPFKHFLCGHNIKEFDVPYICRRMVVNSMSFPKVLD